MNAVQCGPAQPGTGQHLVAVRMSIGLDTAAAAAGAAAFVPGMFIGRASGTVRARIIAAPPALVQLAVTLAGFLIDWGRARLRSRSGMLGGLADHAGLRNAHWLVPILMAATLVAFGFGQMLDGGR
jgi:hypothetical protein